MGKAEHEELMDGRLVELLLQPYAGAWLPAIGLDVDTARARLVAIGVAFYTGEPAGYSVRDHGDDLEYMMQEVMLVDVMMKDYPLKMAVLLEAKRAVAALEEATE